MIFVMSYANFKKEYDKFSPSEQDVLKLTALVIDAVDLSHFSNILKNSNITSLNDQSVTQQRIKDISGKFIQKGFMNAQRYYGFQINKDIHGFVFKETLKDDRLDDFIKAIRMSYPIKSNYSWKKYSSYEFALREIQFALVNKDVEEFEKVRDTIKKDYPEKNPIHFFFGHAFNKDLLSILPIKIQAEVLEEIVNDALIRLKPIDNIEAYLLDIHKAHPDNAIFKKLLGLLTIFQGDIKKKDTFFNAALETQAWVAFLKEDNDSAISLFAQDLKALKKATRKRKIFLEHIAAPFYLVALLKTGDANSYKEILIHAQNAQFKEEKTIIDYFIGLIKYLENQIPEGRAHITRMAFTAMDWLFKGMIACWMEAKLPKEDIERLEMYHQLSNALRYNWVSMEYATILSKLHKDKKKASTYDEQATNLQEKTGIKSMISALQKEEDWERILRALEGLTSTGTSGSFDDGSNTRVAWLVDFKRRNIQPKLQTRNKKGQWSKGRNIAIRRLYDKGEDAVTPQDQKIADTIYTEESDSYYGGTDYYLDFEKAIGAMVGHPRLFKYNSPTVLVELSVVKPELIVEETRKGYEIKFSHQVDTEGISIHQETPTRYNFVRVDSIHQEIAKAMGKQKVSIPKNAKKRLNAFLKKIDGQVALSAALVHSDENLPTKRGDSTMYVHLLPFGEGFKLEMFSKPAGMPPYFKPGKGRKEFVADIKKKRTLIKRNLKKETENAKTVEGECRTLQQVESYQGEWTFDDNETCLNILLELETLKKSGLVTLEWPKGEKIRLTNHVGFDQFSMRIKAEQDWFGVAGELQLDNGQVLDMRELLDLLEKKEASRFVEIKDGQFIALTTVFKKKLAEMNAFMHRSSDGMKVHHLAVAAIGEFTDLVSDLEVDAAWKKQVNRLKRVRKLDTPVPSTFKAELRPYQMNGYQWLQRLAYWGVGACLADDMGLGKTVQALAVLVSRANKGPALVVAPASVCRNWRKETFHFAPTLQPIIFGEGDRKQSIKNLKKHDVLITTYGLLHYEQDLLSSKKFGTIILDEAQAIKNRTAKRSQAAMQLKGDFKILTTGTPIENHLGELWNLFHFINPGLLGTHNSFQYKYAVPIEKEGNKLAKQHLKKLIQPFILRRRKSDVLDDLPTKTEITLSVELSTAEKAFYEALRQSAVDKIAKEQEEKGQASMQILAEIMRLRQACCHPQLVQTDLEIESSKLQLLEEIVQELVENGHKALIFSQFVGHLKIIESLMQKLNITYQYLDGQTPLKKRELSIDAFQSGEGEVFLISLKAGGVGLNLTAADYVIHTDPWWNPAVEDQASDRAHRIGQERPVTIYRLVAEHTIEEKIVALHQHKRDLADSLLEGTEHSGRMSSEDLLALIKEG